MAFEYGRVLNVSPMAYTRKIIGPTVARGRRLNVDEDSDPLVVLEVGFSRGQSQQREIPEITSVTSTPMLYLPGGLPLTSIVAHGDAGVLETTTENMAAVIGPIPTTTLEWFSMHYRLRY
ncbi:hypothetical protein L914_14762 [Phytophthora nicotianae]|uniref:Uncharacterized protein n=2 Tax=Phytophthora nicotianae TaxID=4792 RepID=V9ELS7_PHYNI|nr:hypothetical protein F443_15345 [Phytophthora nicotianae P1569]ETM39043.1 hypothetical protein L914_14762 [Phytophthora nicotianae]